VADPFLHRWVKESHPQSSSVALISGTNDTSWQDTNKHPRPRSVRALRRPSGFEGRRRRVLRARHQGLSTRSSPSVTGDQAPTCSTDAKSAARPAGEGGHLHPSTASSKPKSASIFSNSLTRRDQQPVSRSSSSPARKRPEGRVGSPAKHQREDDFRVSQTGAPGSARGRYEKRLQGSARRDRSPPTTYAAFDGSQSRWQDAAPDRSRTQTKVGWPRLTQKPNFRQPKRCGGKLVTSAARTRTHRSGSSPTYPDVIKRRDKSASRQGGTTQSLKMSARAAAEEMRTRLCARGAGDSCRYELPRPVRLLTGSYFGLAELGLTWLVSHIGPHPSSIPPFLRKIITFRRQEFLHSSEATSHLTKVTATAHHSA